MRAKEKCDFFCHKQIDMWITIDYIPFDIIVVADDDVDFGDVSILGIGFEPAPSFTARLSNLIDSVIAINKTFCRKKENERRNIELLLG